MAGAGIKETRLVPEIGPAPGRASGGDKTGTPGIASRRPPVGTNARSATVGARVDPGGIPAPGGAMVDGIDAVWVLTDAIPVASTTG